MATTSFLPRVSLPVLTAFFAGCSSPAEMNPDSSTVTRDARPDGWMPDAMPPPDGLMTDAAVLDAYVPTGPSIDRPLPDAHLSSTNVFMRFQPGEVPSGLTVTGYQLCRSTDAASVEGAACPNSLVLTVPYASLSLAADTTYYAAVIRTLSDGSSAKSAVAAFTTGHSLAASWKLDEPSGGIAYEDMGGSNGALRGAPVRMDAGASGRAVTLDGVDDAVVMLGSSGGYMGGTAWTYGVWVRTDQMQNGFLFGRENTFAFKAVVAGASLVPSFSVGTQTLQGQTPIGDGHWHHLWIVRDGSQLTAFVDQIPQPGAWASVSPAGSSLISLGNTYNFVAQAGTSWFRGSLDGAQIFGQALSGAERLNETCAGQSTGGRLLDAGSACLVP